MKKILLAFIVLFTLAINSNAQVETHTDSLGVEHIDVYPTFKGGDEAWHKFLDDNMVYPKQARKQNITGKVWLTFIIDEEGNVLNVTVVRGIGGGCDEEAKRVVSLSPKWNPATQDGKPVKVKYNFPINFALR